MPIFTNDTYGAQGRSGFAAAASRNRLRLTCAATLPYSQTTADAVTFSHTTNSTISCVNSSIANVILLWTDVFTAAFFIGQLYLAGKTGKVFLFPDFLWQWTLNPQEFANMGGFPLDYLKGSIGIIPAFGDTTSFRQYFE